MVARVKIKGLDKLSTKLRLRVGRAIKDAKTEKEFTKLVVEETRRGSIEPVLKPSTISNRRRLAKYNRTHKDYIATKSNLTFTGQLLNSLRSIFRASRLEYIISPGNRERRPYKYERGSKDKREIVTAKNTPTNKEIFEYQATEYKRRITQIFFRDNFRAKIVSLIKKAVRDNIK